MTPDEIVGKMRNKGQEFDMLLLLLFTGEGFSYSPINRPSFIFLGQQEKANQLILTSKQQEEDSFAYFVRDGGGLNIICSYGDINTCFIEKKEIFERGRRFFNHQKNLYGYVIKTSEQNKGRCKNRYKYEIIYEHSKDRGINRIVESALLEYIDYFDISSYNEILERINTANKNLRKYCDEISKHVPMKTYFDIDSDQDNEMEFILSKAVINKLNNSAPQDIMNQRMALAFKLNENLFEIYNEEDRFRPTSVEARDYFVGEEYATAWIFQETYIQMPKIYTSLNCRVSIVDSIDEIPDIIQIIAAKTKATILKIATGYMFDSGISMLHSACASVTHNGGRVELIIGSLQSYRPKVKQKMVNRNTADIINAMSRLPYYTIMTYPEKFYHGKFYYISNGEITYIITGSSNVTSTAYRANKELDVIFRFDEKNDPLLLEFEDWYLETKNRSMVINSLDLSLFESNLYKDDMGNKHGASYYRSLTSEEEKSRYRFLESHNPTRVELTLFDRKRDFKAFSKYVAFVFEEKEITILESFSYGNSSYIFSTSDNKELQEKLCRKSKDQAQKESFFISNVPHDYLYEETINKIMNN